MKRDIRLIRNGLLDAFSNVIMMGQFSSSVLPVALQGTAIMLQFSILGAKLIVALLNLSNISKWELHFGMHISFSKGPPLGRLHMMSVMLSLKVGFFQHIRMWVAKEIKRSDKLRSHDS